MSDPSLANPSLEERLQTLETRFDTLQRLIEERLLPGSQRTNGHGGPS